jgi:hypothetical protein
MPTTIAYKNIPYITYDYIVQLWLDSWMMWREIIYNTTDNVSIVICYNHPIR